MVTVSLSFPVFIMRWQHLLDSISSCQQVTQAPTTELNTRIPATAYTATISCTVNRLDMTMSFAMQFRVDYHFSSSVCRVDPYHISISEHIPIFHYPLVFYNRCGLSPIIMIKRRGHFNQPKYSNRAWCRAWTRQQFKLVAFSCFCIAFAHYSLHDPRKLEN